MKILFVSDLYPIKKEENSVLTLHGFVKEWIKQGHEVDVIKPNFIFNSFLRKKPFYKSGFYNYEQVRVLNVNYHLPFMGNIEKKLNNNLDPSDYAIIIAHMPSGIIFANKLAKKHKKPLICGVHESDITVLTKLWYKFYFKRQMLNAYKNAEKIACRSPILKEKLCKMLPDLTGKTFVAPSGTAFTSGSSKRATNEKISVLTCAQLIKRKNIDKLIDAIKMMPDYELKIIGEGAESNKLKKIKSENIKFLGRVEHKKVLAEMEKSDIFILPSIGETFGMVYLEAMSCGCITVGTKGEGIDGILVDKENGYLIEPNTESIKKVLLEIKNSKNLTEIREKAIATAKHYTPEECAQNYLKNIAR